MVTPESPIAQALEAYKVAVFAKDIEAFVALYDQNVHVFDMWREWSYTGIDAWREMASNWFNSLGSEKVVVGVADMQSTTANDLAIGHAVLTFTAVSEDGKELRSLNNRVTLAMRRYGGTWKVVHEHTSAPVNHSTGKVVLRRQLGQ